VQEPAPAAADASRLDVSAFYVSAFPRLVAVLMRVCGSRDEAEEVAQEAFVRLVPRWDAVRRYDDPEAWVRSVAFRIATSRWRRARSAATARLRLGHPTTVDPPGEAAVTVDRLLAGLSVEHRLVLVLHHGLGLPVEEVAHELRLPVGTVKSRLSRARAAAQRAHGRDDDA
jgi:RNA polymerase sigma-70 factor (ECF subfamily)